jgi:hypothetical protein
MVIIINKGLTLILIKGILTFVAELATLAITIE